VLPPVLSGYVVDILFCQTCQNPIWAVERSASDLKRLSHVRYCLHCGLNKEAVAREWSKALLYLESFGNARKFARIARRVSAKKPIVVVKSGSTQAGSRAASSHTGAMATSDIASDVLFRHAGIIRVNIMEELFDVATLLSNQPLPRGRRLVIVTNGGADIIIGGINELEVDTGDDGPYDANADTVNLVASVAVVGDWIEMVSDGTSWYMTGQTNADGGVTTSTT